MRRTSPVGPANEATQLHPRNDDVLSPPPSLQLQCPGSWYDSLGPTGCTEVDPLECDWFRRCMGAALGFRGLKMSRFRAATALGLTTLCALTLTACSTMSGTLFPEKPAAAPAMASVPQAGTSFF